MATSDELIAWLKENKPEVVEEFEESTHLPKQDKYEFKYYLHDDYSCGEMMDFLTDSKFGNLPRQIAENITELEPFYEITLDCVYDVATNAVEIKGAK